MGGKEIAQSGLVLYEEDVFCFIFILNMSSSVTDKPERPQDPKAAEQWMLILSKVLPLWRRVGTQGK